jgi:hypothetical protein
MRPRGNVRSCAGYRVCFGTRGNILCRSHDIEGVQDTGGVFNMGGIQYSGTHRKKGYIYSSCHNLLIQLVLLVIGYETVQPASCRTSRQLMNEQPPDEI